MKNHWFKKPIMAATLALAVSAGLGGCSGEQEGMASYQSADPLLYQSDGQYQLSYANDTYNFNDVDTVEVFYIAPAAYTLDDISAAKSAEELEQMLYTDQQDQSGDEDQRIYAQVESFEPVDEHGFTLSFSVKNQNTAGLMDYIAYFEDLDLYLMIPLESQQLLLESDTESVNPVNTSNLIHMNLDSGRFSDDFDAADIMLSGDFSGLKVEDYSVGATNLTVDLSGTITPSKISGTYGNGIITIAPHGLENSLDSASLSIPVRENLIQDIPSSLIQTEDGIQLSFEINDPDLLESITTEDIHVDGLRILSVFQKDNTLQVVFDLQVDDLNQAAERLNNQLITILQDESYISLAPAAFYPDFDAYVQEGDEAHLSINLYAVGGSFSSDLTSENISFGQDFEGAKIVSLERVEDDLAVLEFSVDDPESLGAESLYGEIALDENSLINLWGTPLNKSVSYTRGYSAESLGRDVNGLSLKSIAAKFLAYVQKYGAATADSIYKAAQGTATPLDLIKVMLNMTGLISLDSGSSSVQDPETIELLKDIQGELKDIQQALTENTLLLKQVLAKLYQDNLEPFEDNLITLESACDKVALYLAIATGNTEGLADLPVQLKTINLVNRQNQPVVQPVESDYESTEAFAQAWKDYSFELVDSMRYAEELGRNGNREYEAMIGWNDAVTSLRSVYEAVANKVGDDSTNNPIYKFDDYCTQIYNFSTIAYPYRVLFRANIEYKLKRAISLLMICDDYMNVTNPSDVINEKQFLAAMDQINARVISDDEGIAFYTIGDTTGAFSGHYMNSPGQYTYSQAAGSAYSLLETTYRKLTRLALEPFASFPVYKITDAFNFTDVQMQDFLKRMKETTLAKELELAEITQYPLKQIDFLASYPGSKGYDEHYITIYCPNAFNAPVTLNTDPSLGLMFSMNVDQSGSTRHVKATYLGFDDVVDPSNPSKSLKTDVQIGSYEYNDDFTKCSYTTDKTVSVWINRLTVDQ